MISLRSLCLFNVRFPGKFSLCGSKRPLITQSSLRIDVFNRWRQKASKSFENQDLYKHQMKLICKTNNNGLVFLEDLRKMIMIAQSDEDLELLFSLIKKFHKQEQTRVVINAYHFGSEVMKLLHLMNRPWDAVQLVEDVDLFSEFGHSFEKTVLLDLLYENGEYEEVIRIFEMYESKAWHLQSHGSSVLLYFAACYKLNTAETFEKALRVHGSVTESRGFKTIKIPLRNTLILVALAIKQNQAGLAFETFHGPAFNFVVENLKFMAYAQTKRFEYLFNAMRDIFSTPNEGKFFLLQEVVSFIENEISKEDCGEQYSLEFQKLKEELHLQSNNVVDKTLDHFLLAPIHYVPDIRINRASLSTPNNFRKRTF